MKMLLSESCLLSVYFVQRLEHADFFYDFIFYEHFFSILEMHYFSIHLIGKYLFEVSVKKCLILNGMMNFKNM